MMKLTGGVLYLFELLMLVFKEIYDLGIEGIGYAYFKV